METFRLHCFLLILNILEGLMAVAANKRSVMTLFSDASDLYSHQVRIVLAEKGVSVEIELVDPNNLPEDLVDLNPYNSVPTLIDRELALYNADIIMEYLDERFPHPPLMPVYPVARAQSRLMMYRIQRNWYTLVDKIMEGSADEADKARKQLREELLALAPVFAEDPYFLSEEFSLVDCYLAPLLWRLPVLGIELTGQGSKQVKDYMTRLFERDSFLASLTEAEREMRLTGQ
jgi:Glutathione S-transferase